MKYSISVIALNAVSAVTSGAGIFFIAKEAPQLAEVPDAYILGLSVSGTALIQLFINGGWKPFFEGISGYGGALIGGIATLASLVSATAGWLMVLDGVGLQRDLQVAAVAPHTQALQAHEVTYLNTAATFAALSAIMQSNAVRESTIGPACDNDSASSWVNECGPRCRFMNRNAVLTSDMSAQTQSLADRMSSVTSRLNTGTQAEIDAAYTEALQLQRAPEMTALRQGVRGLKRELTGSFTDPENGRSYVCKMPDTLALVTEADTALSEVLQLPGRPTRPEPQVDDTMIAAANVLKALMGGEMDQLRSAEKTSFFLALMVELLLLLSLRNDARTERQLGTTPLTSERFENARPKRKLRHPERVKGFLSLLDRYTVNGGKWGRYFAIPYDGDDGAFRTRCLEVVDYLSIEPSTRASSPIDMRGIYPEWVSARAGETGQAALYELYELPGTIKGWRKAIQRSLRWGR